MLSVGTSKHLNSIYRHDIVLNGVNEIILPKLYFIYKARFLLTYMVKSWMLGCLEVIIIDYHRLMVEFELKLNSIRIVWKF